MIFLVSCERSKLHINHLLALKCLHCFDCVRKENIQHFKKVRTILSTLKFGPCSMSWLTFEKSSSGYESEKSLTLILSNEGCI